MTGRDGIKGKNRRGMAVLGGAVGAFAAAAAMATGSAVTAAPAKADFEDLLDPIIQPLMTSLTDSLAGFDPTAAADLTSWTDSFLSSLNALDVTAALPSAAEPAASTTISGTGDIPITMQEGTEPTVLVSVDGSTPEATLVDTGSSGLLVPINDLSLTQLFDLGFPTGINSVSFSGGIDAFYLEYNDAMVGYGDGALTTTNTPLDVEFFSFPTSFSAGSPLDFQQFLTDDASPGGILGIGSSGETGPGIGPFEAAGVSGVTVDLNPAGGELVVGSNAGTPIEPALNGAAIPTSNLTETVTNSSGTVIGSGSVSDDVDSGGVYGTIPSTIASNVAQGDTISVYDGNTLLYQYLVGTDSFGTNEAPTVTTGTAGATNAIDSGVEPFLKEPIFISYGGTNADGAITFDKPLT
jgi:hypothetical protein